MNDGRDALRDDGRPEWAGPFPTGAAVHTAASSTRPHEWNATP